MFPFHPVPVSRRAGAVPWMGPGVLVLFALAVQSVIACDACQERLIDESAEPPLFQAADYAEEVPVAASPRRVPRGPGVLAPAGRQVQGALSGRIVYMNSGHGWTWDPAAWRQQRGVLQEMNEDYGNLDQLNFFAACCFNAGATVVSLRPLGHQVNEVVLDNDDAGVTWEGTWQDSASSLFYGSPGDVPYRYAALAAAESATAMYVPDIPEAGLYPVYTWVRHGSDRGWQLYRIRHTGGESLVRIPHHMVGNGWVYLGEYAFAAGAHADSGAVVVSNERGSAEGSYTFADAIRFGNGMGTVDRGTGVSGYPREDESCRYWVQANLGQGQAASLYDGSGADESDSWSVPPKMSAEMNREDGGSPDARIHISFHSNAGGGRGAVGLITSDPSPRQSVIAQLCGAEVNNDLRALGAPPLEVPWTGRTSYTYTGGYSEIDGSLANYEMPSTIVEVAFHDSAEDAKIMRSAVGRWAIGKATMHAVIRYMNQYDGAALVFPPDAPEQLRATAGADGTATLRWSRPVAVAGAGAPAGYVIYRSADGVGFGQPVETGNVSAFTLTDLSPGQPHWFRVAAVNAGGESFPSNTAGCRIPDVAAAPRVLIVDGFDRNDRTLNLRQNVTRQSWTPPGDAGVIERVLPSRSNSFSYTVPHGQAVSAFGWAFDTCRSAAVADGSVALTDYPVVMWASGQESSADESFSVAEQGKVSAFRAGGGHLFVSGSEIAWDLDRASGPTAADRAFLAGTLQATLAANADDDSGSYTVLATPGGIFAGRAAGAFDDGTRGIYPVRYPDILTPQGNAVAALTYGGTASRPAALQADRQSGSGRLVYFGFPLETVVPAAQRNAYAADALTFFSADGRFIAGGAVWRYRDSGVTPPAAWVEPGFDDSGWSSGAARIGYGGDGEVTEISSGPAGNVHPSAWFRRRFTVADAVAFPALRLEMQRDDGVLVRLNGREILRDNLPAGPVTATTLATAAVTGAEEGRWRTWTVPATGLVSGANVLTVELHQASPTSSDAALDLRLTGLRSGGVLTFGEWQSLTFGSDAASPEISGELADPDGDGVANLLHYALGSAPREQGLALALTGWNGGPVLTFSRSMAVADAVLRLEAAGDPLGPWMALAEASPGESMQPVMPGVSIQEAPGGAVSTVSATVSSTAPIGFFRLAVRQVP